MKHFLIGLFVGLIISVVTYSLHNEWNASKAPAAQALASADTPAPPVVVGADGVVEVDGARFVVPEGHGLRVVIDDFGETIGGDRTHRAAGTSTGAGLRARGGDAASDFHSEAPALNLPWFFGSAGSSTTGGLFAGAMSVRGVRGLNIFHLLGGALLLGAGALWWFVKPPPMKYVYGAAGLGAVSIALGSFMNSAWSGYLGAALVVGVLGLVAYLVVRERQNQKKRTALHAIVHGVDALPDDLHDAVTDKIKEKAGADDLVVRAVVKDELKPTG